MSSDFPALEQILARSLVARAVRAATDAARSAWAHSAAVRQMANGRAALGALPAGERLRFWSLTLVWMGIGLTLYGVVVPRYSAPVWPVGQGLALAVLGAVLAAGSTRFAAAWPRSALYRWYLRNADPDQTSDA